MVWHHRLEEYNVQGVLSMLVLNKVWVHAAQRQLKSLRDHFLDQSGCFLVENWQEGGSVVNPEHT